MTKQPILLRIFKDGKLVDVKQFTLQQIIIGRQGEINLELEDKSVSPIHAMIEERGHEKYFICDLGSDSGTFVDGQKIVDRELQPGSEFQIGAYKIEFHIGVPKPKKVSPPIKEVIPPKPAAPRTTPTQTHFRGSGGGLEPVKGKTKKTFAPPSTANFKENLKSTKGNTVEIILAWQERVINTYHFKDKGVIQIGSHPKNHIILPVFGSVRVSHPIVKIDGVATIFITSDMTGELIKSSGQSTSFEELRHRGQMTNVGVGYSHALQQGDVAKIGFGEGVQLVIRYVGGAPETRSAPWLDLSVNQLTALILGLMATVLFLFYAFIYAPPPPEPLEDETEPPRKAQFFYKQQPIALEETKPAEVTQAPKTAQQPIKDQEVAPARGEEGASRDAKPNKSQSTKIMPTTDKPGKDKGIQKVETAKKTPDSGAKSAVKDVTKSGVLSVFGTKGVQDQLNKAFQGSGNVAGLSKSATGEGAEARGAGITPGAGLRETGAGGQGTATVGISGVTTKGRGGGVSGYGTGALGAKKNATILAGGDEMTATGTIDRDAIRRVVQANLKQIKACYDKALNKDPSLYGKIVIQWTILPGGAVGEASIRSTTLNSPTVESCAVARLRTWKFPEPPTDQVPLVSYPFVFQAQE